MEKLDRLTKGTPLEQFVWEEKDLPVMLDLVAGMLAPESNVRRSTGQPPNADTVNLWVSDTMAQHGIETQQIFSAGVDWNAVETKGGILRIRSLSGNYYFLATKLKRGRFDLLAADGTTKSLGWREVVAISSEEDKAVVKAYVAGAEFNRFLDVERYEDLLVPRFEEKVDDFKLARVNLEGWLFRNGCQAPLLRLMREHKILPTFSALLVSQVISMGLNAVLWVMLFLFATSPNTELSWFYGWLVLAVSAVFFNSVTAFLAQDVVRLMGTFLKRLLMEGVMRVDDDLVKGEGSGKSMSRAFESEGIVQILSTGIIQVVSLIVSLAYVILAIQLGFQAGSLTLLFLVILATAAGLARAHWHAAIESMEEKMSQTHWLFDYVNGFRTKVVQGAPWDWSEIDRSLASYSAKLQKEDERSVRLLAVIPYLWLTAALVVLLLASLNTTAQATPIFVTLGGIIFGYITLQGIVGLASQLVPQLSSWKAAKLLVDAARSPANQAEFVIGEDARSEDKPLLSFHDVSFRYESRDQPVLRNVDWKVYPGDQIMITGASGSGKSTLVSLLTGLKLPTAGVYFVGGVDARTLQDEIRHVVALAPQFHENVILQGSLLFNLCLGFKWPLEDRYRSEVEELCEELGLGNLIERMPSGLSQIVGEGGWQLSHGEKSRVFLARTLLQKAQVVILDESFSALDPDLMIQCVECVRKRAKTLLIISHDQESYLTR